MSWPQDLLWGEAGVPEGSQATGGRGTFKGPRQQVLGMVSGWGFVSLSEERSGFG